MPFEKSLNTFKISLLKSGGATSRKEYLVQTTADTAVAAFDAAYDVYKASYYASYASYYASYAAYNAAIKAPYKSFFFKPYNLPLDFVERVVTIISAPISLSLLAVEQLVEFLVLGLKSIVDFARGGSFNFEKPIDAICSSFKLLLMAIVSPLLNTVDVIGSSIASGLNKSNIEEEDLHLSLNT